MKKNFLLFLFFLYASGDAQVIPKPSGTWDVGRILTELSDSAREEIRIIPLWIWYPVEKTDTITPDFPLPETWRKEQGKYLDKKIGASASNYLQTLKVWSVQDAPVNHKNIKFPLLLFGAGHTWLPTDYSTVIEDIVSHGYIVAGYVPTGFAGVTILSDGRVIHGTLTVHHQDILFKDAAFVLKNIPLLNKTLLNGIIDTKLIGFFGHSQGGAAAIYTAGRDTAVKVVVNLDGDLMGSALEVRLTQPALLLSNDERMGISAAAERMDREGRERSEYRRHADWVKVTDDSEISLRIRLNGIRHLNFNDLGLIPPEYMTDAEKKDKLGSMDGVKSLKTISELTRMFFDYNFKGIPFPTLVELGEKYSDAQVILWKGIKYYPGEK